jgi:ABC-type multidrug transport system fused ATPase/permease subunit
MTERMPSLLELGGAAWRLLDAAQRRECVYAVLLSMLAACFTVAGVAGVAPFLATLADPGIVERNAVLARVWHALGSPAFGDFVVWLGLGLVALLVLANAANLLASLAIARFAQRVGACFHALMFDEYLRRSVAFHARANGDVLATHVVEDVNRTVGGVIHSGLSLVASAFVIGLIAAAVVTIDPLVALGAAVLLGSSYAVIYAFVRRRLIRDGVMTARLWSARAKVIAESFEAIKDVAVFGAREEFAARVAAQSAGIAAAHARVGVIAASPRYALECVTAAGLVAAALWIYRGAGAGQWLTHLSLLGLAAYRLLPPIQQAFAAVARIRSDVAAFERIAGDLRSARARPRTKVDDAAARDWKARPRREIRLSGVSYRHSSERDGGVTDVSLTIEAGALVGLAGPNGSGKTTLADLILGVLAPDAGEILIDGVPLDERNRAGWLTTVAHVPQQIVLLDATVAENVAFGVPRAAIDRARVREALRDACLESAVDALPHGLETTIGQHGAQLSGGQRQRLGVARALYRRASLLVLDEATSALDAAAETEIVEWLRAQRSRRTIVLIAHRPSSLQRCDEVLELEGGRLAGRRRALGRAPVSESIRSAGGRP